MPTESIERRGQPRIVLAQVVRMRPLGSKLPLDFCTTFNASQEGLYVATSAGHYDPGANVYVTSDFQPGKPIDYAMTGVVVRVDKLEGDKWGVAIHFHLKIAAFHHE